MSRSRSRSPLRHGVSKWTDAFLMDFENWCLEHKWLAEDYAPKVGKFLAWLDKPRPRGAGRYLDAEWAAMMRSELENSDLSWEQYCEWVRHGGGDEWFQDEAGLPKGT